MGSLGRQFGEAQHAPELAHAVTAPPTQQTRAGAAGIPIVFLHGAGLAGASWHRQVEAFASSHQCLTIDLPGHGASHHIRWESLDATADAVARVIAASFVGTVHVVGFSLGGAVALRLLARHPELVHSLLVTGANTQRVSALHRMLSAVTWPVVATPLAHCVFVRAMELGPAARQAQLAGSRPLRVGDYSRLSGELLRGVDITDIAGSAAAMRTPVLALAGSREFRYERRTVHDVATRLPRCCGAEVRGVSHTWHVRHANHFNAILREWMERPGTIPTNV